MINSILNLSYEFYLFIAVEALIIIIYLLFYKYSRKHGGVFDRRIRERRSYNTHGSDRRMLDFGFREAYAVHLNASDIFNSDQDRRIRQRRHIVDRRSL